MLYYDKIGVSEEIDVNKSSKSKECMIFYDWYFLDSGYTYEPKVCNGCHDISTTTYELKNIAIMNIKDVDYRYVTWNMSRSDAINKLIILS